MSDEASFLSTGMVGVWSSILTAGLGYMGYYSRKRDDAIDAARTAITQLELKVAENYATKPTVMALFQEATTQTKDAVARVEKSIDATNISVAKLDTKIDRGIELLGTLQTNVMRELSKKT